MKDMLIAKPISIPISNGNIRHAKNEPRPGTKSVSVKIHIIKNHVIFVRNLNFVLNIINAYVLLLRHIGLMTFTSTMNITADIMTAANAAFGMYRKNGVKNNRDTITSNPE